jgi:hypothetical protein
MMKWAAEEAAEAEVAEEAAEMQMQMQMLIQMTHNHMNLNYLRTHYTHLHKNLPFSWSL